MKLIRLKLLFLITIILAACASSSATQPVEVRQGGPTATFPTSAPLMNYPQPANATPFPTELPYPAPGTVNQGPSGYPGPATPAAVAMTPPATNYAPQPGDDKLSQGQATVDIAKSSLITTGTPLVVTVDLLGDLPDPCHQLRIINMPPDNQKKIQVEVYSVYDPGQICITVIQPFQVLYLLGSYPSGHYSVYVNGVILGSFDG